MAATATGSHREAWTFGGKEAWLLIGKLLGLGVEGLVRGLGV